MSMNSRLPLRCCEEYAVKAVSRAKPIAFILTVVGSLLVGASIFRTRGQSVPAARATSKQPPGTSHDSLFVSTPGLPSGPTYPYSVIAGGRA